MADVAHAFLTDVRGQFRKLKAMADGALAQVPDEAFFATIDPGSNSVAVITKHMAGNLRSRFRDFLTSDGEKPDRHRDGEFEVGAEDTRPQVMAAWEDGWQVLFQALDGLGPDDLSRTVTIRGEPHSVLQALNRALAHQANHVGQVVYLARHYAGPAWRTLSIPRGQSAAFDPRARPAPGGDQRRAE